MILKTRVSTNSKLAAIFSLFILTVGAAAVFTLYFKQLDESSLRLNQDLSVSAVLLDAEAALSTGQDLGSHIKKLKSLELQKSSFEKSSLKKIANLYIDFNSKNSKGEFAAADIDGVDKSRQRLQSELFSFYRSQVKYKNLEIATIVALIYQDIDDLNVSSAGLESRLKNMNRTIRSRLDSIEQVAHRYENPGLVKKNIRSISFLLSKLTNKAASHGSKLNSRTNAIDQIKALSHNAIKEVQAKSNDFISVGRNEFIYAVLLFAICLVLGFVIMQLAAKRIQLKMDKMSIAFMRVMQKFSHPEDLDQVKNEIKLLSENADWAPIYRLYATVEDKFIKKYAAELAFSRNLKIPYFILNEKKEAIYWNSHAIKSLGLSSTDEAGCKTIEEIFTSDLIGKNDKQGKIVEKELQDWLQNKNEFIYQLFIRTEGKMYPYEIMLSAINAGPLKGGKILTLRNCAKESEIVNRHVEKGLSESKEIVSKMIEGNYDYEIESAKYLALAPAAAAQVDLLKELRLKVKEKEELWQSETEALLQQNQKERDS